MLSIFAIGFVASSTTLADDYMYVKAAHLNVRSKASVKSKIVAVIDSGYKVTVLNAQSNGWSQVLLENGQIGYVANKFLATAEPYYEKVTSARYTIKSGSAFMRGFDLKRKVAVLNQGDVLEVTSEKVYLNRWIQVRVVDAKSARYNWRTGYVAKRLLAPMEGFEYTAPVEEVAPAPVEETPADLMPDLNSAPEAPAAVETPADTGTSTDSSADSSADADLEGLLKGLE